MIQIQITPEKYRYDIHSLVQAFFPGEEIRIVTNPIEDREYRLGINLRFDEDLGKVEASFFDIGRDVILKGEAVYSQSEGKQGERKDSADLSTNGSSASLTTEKNAVKQMLYRMLSELIGRKLPWGALTGIRPTKIAMNLLEKGERDDRVLDYLTSVFFVSRKKASLALEIAHREQEMLRGIQAQDGYSLYIGIPFCPTTCLYCSFPSYPIARYAGLVENYLSCLYQEMDEVAQIMRGKQLNTIYVGGGTPTTLSPAQSADMLAHLRKTFDFTHLREFTVESGRPDSMTMEKLRTLREFGVDRISVNPQSMREETLHRIGRAHTVRQTVDAFYLAREAGFDQINMDLILGLPGETEEDVAYTLREIEKLSPDDLTVHSLAVKRGSKLHEILLEERRTGRKTDLGEETKEEGEISERMMQIAETGARGMGLSPYYLYRQKNMAGNLENIGFAREGKEGLYNILIMEEVQSIVALGAGSVSKRVFSGGREGRIERCDNVKEVTQYISRIEEMIDRKRKLFL